MVRKTGERPGWGSGYEYDESRHLLPYRYAAGLAEGLRVLDAGCGEGFGTQELAEVAAHVTGLDRAPDAVAFCRRRWRRPNLAFIAADLRSVHAVPVRFDLVCCFQVLEHQRDDEGFLRRLARLLLPGGTLVLTTPNVLRSFSENPHHVREYRPEELRALLRRVFGEVTLLGVHGNAAVHAYDAARARAVRRVLALDPLGLRNRLPDRVVQVAFPRLAAVVRRRTRRAGEAITSSDFEVHGDDLDTALDLLAVCR